MTDNNVRERRRWLLPIICIAGVLVVAAVGFGIWQGLSSGSDERSATDDSSSPTAPEPSGSDGESEEDMTSTSPSLGPVLPRAMGGQEAIDELGDNIVRVANQNGMTPEELEELLLSDSTVRISPQGTIFYGESTP